jgi:hypothetical protein
MRSTLGLLARPSLLILGIFALTQAAGCNGGGAVGPKGGVTLAKVVGDADSGLAGYPVNVPPAVKVSRALGGGPAAGITVTFAVTSGGGSITGATVTSDTAGIARLGSWQIQAGPNTVTATVAGQLSSPTVFTVTGVSSAYSIDVRYISGVSVPRRAVFAAAAHRWAQAIYGAVQPIPLNLTAGQCGSNSPAMNETVTSIVIFVTLDSIDGPGKILGQSGPCFIRSSGFLPIVGAMQFDTADVAALEASGQFSEVILHEMGHVLGYGTIWGSGFLDLLVGPSQSGGADPHFIGAQALNAFAGIGGGHYTGGQPVPVENTGGPGTADAHWRESVFGNELMTGYLNGGANPLSVVSIASMGDLGYVVNYGAADPYVHTFTVRAGETPVVHLTNDILSLPIYAVSPAGRVMGVYRH